MVITTINILLCNWYLYTNLQVPYTIEYYSSTDVKIVIPIMPLSLLYQLIMLVIARGYITILSPYYHHIITISSPLTLVCESLPEGNSHYQFIMPIVFDFRPPRKNLTAAELATSSGGSNGMSLAENSLW